MLTKSDITILMQQVDVTKAYDQPTAAAVDIRADYVAKNGNPNAAAPKIFFRIACEAGGVDNISIILAIIL